MSINHSLSFPILEHETATSYVSRLTRYCGLTSPNDFCLDHGFRWQDFVRGDDFLFDKVAAIGGANAEDMRRWAVRTVDRNRFEISGQQATKMSLVRTRLRVCPKCLVEDRERRGPLGAYRRHTWHLLSVRSCAVHDAPLVTLEPEQYTIQNYDFAGLVERQWPSIKAEAQMGLHRPFTSLESYIRDRLEGIPHNPFLDAMPMYIATRPCELLGFVLEYGPNLKISDASEDDLSKVGGIGLLALQSGEAGLYAALDTLVSPVGLRTVRHRSDLGAFFEWLRPSSLGAEFDPLKNMVRDYIFRTYPCGEGDMVLGEICPATSRYSIHGAWQALGIQRNRMNRFLIAEGVAQKDEGEQGLAAFKIDLALVRAALPQFEMDGLTKGDASRFLRVTYPTINHLIDEGLLTSKRVRNPKSRQFLDAICSESIVDFQNSFETLGQLANRYGRASGPLGCHLEAKGICPLETPSGVSWYYERQGLEGRLCKAGLTMPQGRN